MPASTQEGVCNMAHRWPSRSPRLFTLVTLALVSFLVIASIAGCASSTNANGAETGNATVTTAPTSAPKSTATSAPTTCNQVPGFAQAGPAPQVGALLGSIPFPGNSVFTDLAHVAGGGVGLYEVQLMHVCTANTTVSAIHSQFASQAPGHGWTQSSTYPYDGGYQASCGDPYCWSRVPSLPNFLSLEKVTAVGNGLVTYGIRLAIPPSVPDCSAIAPPGGGTPTMEFFWSQQKAIPVPPLTSEGLGDGHGVGSKGVYSQSMCSPGTVASVKTFMSAELGKLGFKATNQSECGTTGWVVKGSLAISWNVSNPKDWSLSYCQ